MPRTSALLHIAFIARQEGSAKADAGRRCAGEAATIISRLTDSSIEWEKTYDYHADTVTVVCAAEQA